MKPIKYAKIAKHITDTYKPDSVVKSLKLIYESSKTGVRITDETAYAIYEFTNLKKTLTGAGGDIFDPGDDFHITKIDPENFFQIVARMLINIGEIEEASSVLSEEQLEVVKNTKHKCVGDGAPIKIVFDSYEEIDRWQGRFALGIPYKCKRCNVRSVFTVDSNKIQWRELS